MPIETNEPSLRRAEHTPTALPSATARIVAFTAIVLAGLCGGVIGYALVVLESDDTVLAGAAALVGAVGSAAGVAVVATLALRATTEWRVIEHTRDSRSR